MSQSDKVRIGAGFVWFRPTITADLKVTLGSRYTGDTVPDQIFSETDMCWSLSGTFLGQTQGIDIEPTFKDDEIEVNYVNAPTDDFLESQSVNITVRSQYNGITDITDIVELPETVSGSDYFGGRNIAPYKGSLLILESNIRNSNQQYRHIVKCRLYYNCRVIPGKISLNNGHTSVEMKFRVLAAIDPSTGCYLGSTYHRWITSIQAPNTAYMPSGLPVNTDIDVPYPFAGSTFMNL